MPRGDKSKYTDKQERKADHIAESYENRGVPEQEAERRAWATVNKDDGGGERPGGSGRGKSTGHPAAHKGGRKGARRRGFAVAGQPIGIGEKGGGHPETQRGAPRARLAGKPGRPAVCGAIFYMWSSITRAPNSSWRQKNS